MIFYKYFLQKLKLHPNRKLSEILTVIKKIYETLMLDRLNTFYVVENRKIPKAIRSTYAEQSVWKFKIVKSVKHH